MARTKKVQKDIKVLKQEVNWKHIEFYDKTLEILTFILDEYAKELTNTEITFLDLPKNTAAVLDFLISSIVRVQKGQRTALGMDETELSDTEPEINIIEGLSECKI